MLRNLSVCLWGILWIGLVFPAPSLKFLGLNSIEEFKSFIANSSDLDPHKDLLVDILETELAFSDTYYVLYHGQSHMRLIQDLISLLEHSRIIDDFFYFRVPKIPDYSVDNIHDFFQQSMYDNIDDENPSLRKYLLSVNPTLFSNYNNKECSTLDFWLNGSRSYPPPDLHALLQSILEAYKIDPEEAKTLLSIYEPIRKQDHTLIQIFIPKTEPNIQNYLYFSHDRGKPCHHMQRSTSIAELLSYFETNLDLIPHYESMQLRLLISNAFLLNPQSNICMKRYITPLNQNDLNQYLENLEKWAFKTEKKLILSSR